MFFSHCVTENQIYYIFIEDYQKSLFQITHTQQFQISYSLIYSHSFSRSRWFKEKILKSKMNSLFWIIIKKTHSNKKKYFNLFFLSIVVVNGRLPSCRVMFLWRSSYTVLKILLEIKFINCNDQNHGPWRHIPYLHIMKLST